LPIVPRRKRGSHAIPIIAEMRIGRAAPLWPSSSIARSDKSKSRWGRNPPAHSVPPLTGQVRGAATSRPGR
jgi:hypothetical protein